MKESNELFKVLTIQEAMQKLRPYFLNYYQKQEEISLDESYGRILAGDLQAGCDLPHFRKSTVDGLAVRAEDTFGASESLPAFIVNKGEIFMGKEPSRSIGRGEGMLIPTGGALPAGADAVVMIENIEDYGDSLYGVSEPVGPGENYIDIGEDYVKGETILRRYSIIRSQEMGLLAAQGIVKIPVIKRLKIGILSTGDEIVPPEAEPKPAQTRDINSYSLMGQALASGCEVQYYGIIGDSEAELSERLRVMQEENDLIILSGGSSVGSRDLTSRIIEEAGEGLLFHGLAIKPGKPTLAGVAQGKLIFGLPGHPASAMVVFDTIIRPWLDSSYESQAPRPYPEGVLTQNIYSGSGREEFVQVRVLPDRDDWKLEPVRGKSGLIRTMVLADGVIHVNLDDEGLQAGRRVKVRLLR